MDAPISVLGDQPTRPQLLGLGYLGGGIALVVLGAALAAVAV